MREDAERFEPGSLARWRAWLAEHHPRGRGVWLVTWKAGSGGLGWIAQARRPETRAGRIAETAASAAVNVRANRA